MSDRKGEPGQPPIVEQASRRVAILGRTLIAAEAKTAEEITQIKIRKERNDIFYITFPNDFTPIQIRTVVEDVENACNAWGSIQYDQLTGGPERTAQGNLIRGSKMRPTTFGPEVKVYNHHSKGGVRKEVRIKVEETQVQELLTELTQLA